VSIRVLGILSRYAVRGPHVMHLTFLLTSLFIDICTNTSVHIQFFWK
jgi:hypothetical protein